MKTIKALCIVITRRMLVGIVAVIIVMKPLPVHASTTIEHLQLMLNELGFDAGPADGISGPRTEAAVADFLDTKEDEETSLGFGVIEAIYDAYRAETGRTVFDIYGTESFEFGLDIKEFPATPYGDISRLQQAAVDDRSSYLGNYCGEVSQQVRVLQDIGTLIGVRYRHDNPRDRWRTVAQDAGNWPTEGGDARGKYNHFVQTLALDLLLHGTETSADRLSETLLRYARADAFEWVNGSTVYKVGFDDTYSLKSVFGPTLSAWSVLSNQPNVLSVDQFNEIDQWVWRVTNRIDYVHGRDPSLTSNRNNQRYMLATILMQLGLLYESEYYVHRSLFEASLIAAEMRNDGSLPHETSRGRLALHYSGHAASSLVTLAEFASLLGHDLYEHEAVKVRSVMEFFARALREPEAIERYAGVRQPQISSWRLRAMPAYCRRYPEADNCGGIGYEVDGLQMFPRMDMGFDLDGLVNQCVNALMWSAEVRPTQ